MNISYHFLQIAEIILKLVVSSLCAGLLVINLEKQIKKHLTYILVMTSLGSCLIVVIWQQLSYGDVYASSIAFFISLVVAVGIFTSSIIIINKASAMSIVIGASVWVAAGIGIAIGYTLYFTAIIASVLGFIIFRFVNGLSVEQE